ncbi:MAG TPA: AAA family ATPase [Bryobacteraceae bacterium]|jgi:predicted ATPase|nr:AAA family ATPase [Bryobacteraceae bacterium]
MPINQLKLKRILSFNDCTVELGALNVLIGPNAAGKSNLIEVIGLLQAAPKGIEGQILRGGGVRQWLWLGARDPTVAAEVECDLALPGGMQTGPLLYRLEFWGAPEGFEILHEHLMLGGASEADGTTYFTRNGKGVQFGAHAQGLQMSPRESVLARLKVPGDPTPITPVGELFEQIKIFREFRTGPTSQARSGISTSASKDSLWDGGDNLALVLHELDFLGAHDRIKEYLKRFCDRFEDVKVSVGEGLARTFLREAGLSEMLSGFRVSDGTLKFLCLLAVLFHPRPAPLICIEEPELGLHPDALRLVAEVLVEASERTQLVVTTHSEALVDALTDRPEAVLVCERDFDNGTQFHRLSSDELDEWLEHYTLGELWRKGEIGGGR